MITNISMNLSSDENDNCGWKQVTPNKKSTQQVNSNRIEYSMDYIKTIKISQNQYDVIIPKLNNLLTDLGLTLIKEPNTKNDMWLRNQYQEPETTKNKSDIKYIVPKNYTKQQPKIGLDTIKLNLNKLTDKNYLDISVKMENMIHEWLKTESSSEEVEKMGELIFTIASNNRMFSKVYADLYCYLSEKIQIIADTFYPNFVKYCQLFDNITSVVNQDDYDEFCKMNILNEKRRSVSLFMVNLTKNNMIKSIELYQIISNLLNKLNEMITMPDKVITNQELVDNIIILYDDGSIYNDVESFSKENNIVVDCIRMIATSNKSTILGINSKTKFKCMDYLHM
jgi:hypothetical protein